MNSPNCGKLLQSPAESAITEETTQRQGTRIKRTLLRFHFNSSTIRQTGPSIRLTALVKAAIRTATKKMMFQRAESGSFWKASGRTLKMRDGPLSGAKPMAKTTGKIAKPAMTETRVSSMATVTVDLGILLSGLR